MKNPIRFSLILTILFSFSTFVKAQDYQLVIITPSKYETIAQQFLTLHDDASDWTIRGVYATVEEIVGRYDQQPSEVVEPSTAVAPPVPATPGQDQIGKGYENDVSRSIIKFLRGILEFDQEHNKLSNGREERFYAFDVLRDKNGNLTGYVSTPLQYLLILGETGAAGTGNVTSNGVPESWYVFMDPGVYGENSGADGTWFPTDFFYASPDYYDGIDWVPNLIVGRIPIHDLDAALYSGGTVTALGAYDAVSDTTLVYDESADWVPVPGAGAWADSDLVITCDGDANGTNAIGATYLILDNGDTWLVVQGDPANDGVEADPAEGDCYEIRDTRDEAQVIFDKCAAYDAEVKSNPDDEWNNWFRKVVTVGGDSYPTIFSFWDEFVLAHITNQGYFEGNEIIKLRHTNKDDGDSTNEFTVTSLAPYLNDTDCGLLFHLGIGDVDQLLFDDAIMDTTLVLGYTSADFRIPIVVSNAGLRYEGSGRFDVVDGTTGIATPSFGEAVVESPTGGGIAFIGSTDIAYSGIIPFFNNGVVYQNRLFNMDELLGYTMESFHSAPKYIGDIFTGSPDLLGNELGPINEFIANNDIAFTSTPNYWHTQKTIFEYTLLGDPCLPVPYPQSTAIETGTSAPGLAFNENTLRNRTPKYESHDIPVDEIPTGGSTSTILEITPVNSPAAVLVKKTLIDIRRDIGVTYTAAAAPADYTFTTADNQPGYYFVKVEQLGYDDQTSAWGNWWAKETWIYVQEVNEFTRANNILVVDDDFGYPFVTTATADGYEDWYLNALDELVESYDVWHVDFDDAATVYAGGADDWAGADVGATRMHGEVYQSLLDDYDKVIWLTGDPSGYGRPYYLYLWYTEGISIWNIETLTPWEQTCLKNYLNGSGRLFLSGQGILRDLGCSGLTEEEAANRFCERKSDSFAIQNEFLTDYLHITDLYSSIGYGSHPLLKNVSGNPVVSESYTINIAGEDGAENQYIFVDAEPNVDTPIVSRVFEYTSLSGAPPYIGITPFFGTAGTAYYRGLGAHVFLPWGFEAINNQTKRNEVMGAILSWLDDPTRTGEGEDEGGDDDVGNGDVSVDDGVGTLEGCFIATACYGTPMAEEVIILSNFKDEYLLTNSLGRFFVKSYYKFSPYLAEYISHRPLLKKFIRIGLKPLVRFSEMLVEE